MLPNRMKLAAMSVALAATTGTTIVHAGETGLYIGLNGGQAVARKYCDNVTNCKNDDTSLRGEVGYQFTRHWSAELGYTSFGTLFDGRDNNVSAKQDASAWTLSGLGTLPIGTSPFGIFGRVGLARYNLSNSGTVQGVAVESKNAIKPYFGGGVRLDLGANWMVRAEYQLYTDISGVNGVKDNVHGWYAGGAYRF
jgi:opacity protein-like surface antigen